MYNIYIFIYPSRSQISVNPHLPNGALDNAVLIGGVTLREDGTLIFDDPYIKIAVTSQSPASYIHISVGDTTTLIPEES